jgi:hypothetical protein
MKIELIPVLEIEHYSDDLPLPSKSPFWQYPNLWDDYRNESLATIGFMDMPKAFSEGSSYYELSSLSDDHLSVLFMRAVEEMDDPDFESDEAPLLQGGVVLLINDLPIFYPQCCCSLADLDSWEELTKDAPQFFYHGHPSPSFNIKKTTIELDFIEHGFGSENFVPPVPTEKIELDKTVLKNAIAIVKEKLRVFEERLMRVNQEKQLGIKNIDKALKLNYR